MSDAELMQKASEGDIESFSELVSRYERPMIHYFRRFTENHGDAEDCAQEVFIKLFRARERYCASASFRTFLYTIATNHWIDVYRQKKNRPQERSLDADFGGDSYDSSLSIGDFVVDPSPLPFEVLSAKELSAWLKHELSQLSEEHRAVWVLAEEQSLQYSEISEILGIPVGTVKSRMHAINQRLRTRLRREMDSWEPESARGFKQS